MRYKSWLFLLAALLLAACSKDSDQTLPPVDPQPKPDTPAPVPTEVPLNLVRATRAGEPYDAATAWDVHSPIQFFLMSGATETAITQKREGEFFYDPEATTPGWYSSIGIKDPHNCIYGYSPATVGLCDIRPVEGSSYRNGAVMELTSLSAASGYDLCAVVGIRHGSTKAATEKTPDRGQFYFAMTTENTENYVSLLLDHLFARIDFNLKLGAEYSKRRFVKIKKIELRSSYELTKVTVKVTPSETDVTYTTAPVAADGTPSTGTIYDFTLDAENEEGRDVTVDGSVFPGFFAPDASSQIASGLSLVCTYDVYAYNNKIGSRVREDCVSVNSLSSLSALTKLTRGKKTTVNLKIEPTYLYQLVEDELDNPTVVVSVE